MIKNTIAGKHISVSVRYFQRSWKKFFFFLFSIYINPFSSRTTTGTFNPAAVFTLLIIYKVHMHGNTFFEIGFSFVNIAKLCKWIFGYILQLTNFLSCFFFIRHSMIVNFFIYQTTLHILYSHNFKTKLPFFKIVCT